MSVSQNRRSFLRGGRPSASEWRPPWTTASITDVCTRCERCVEACPENVLFRGDGGFPQIRFTGEGCTLCGECAGACPEPVFELTRQAFPWRAVIQDHCLAKANIHCSTCRDACETSAIRFPPKLGHVAVPEVTLEDCTGCGACVAVCPEDAIGLEAPQTENPSYA